MKKMNGLIQVFVVLMHFHYCFRSALLASSGSYVKRLLCVFANKCCWPSNTVADWIISWNVHLLSQSWYGFINIACQTFTADFCCGWPEMIEYFQKLQNIPCNQSADWSHGFKSVTPVETLFCIFVIFWTLLYFDWLITQDNQTHSHFCKQLNSSF